MKLGLGLGIGKAQASPAPFIPAGVFTQSQAVLSDQSHFNLGASTQVVTASAGQITIGAAGVPVFDLPSALTGNYWAVTQMQDGVVNSYRPGLLGPVYTPEALRARGGIHSWKFPLCAGSTQARIIRSSTSDLALTAFQFVNVAPTLAKASKVRIGIGQSPGTGVADAAGYVWGQDGWMHVDALYCAGSANTGYGTTVGSIAAMIQPLQSSGMSGALLDATVIRDGVSPYGAAINGIMSELPSTHNSMLVQAAVSGAGFHAADAPWNSLGSNPVAWNNYVTQMNALVPQLVVGSAVDMIFFAGGEAETAADMSFFPASFAAFMGRITADLIIRGLCAAQPPVVILNIPADCVVTNRDKVRDAINQMDSQSGHANSLAYVHVVNAPGAGLVDATHRTNAANRIAGAAMASLIKARGLV